MNVLFIGNSYTYYHDLEKLFASLCRSNGKQVDAYRVTSGGRKLIQYTDAEDPVTRQLADTLQCRQYDVVFLQEQSLLPATDFELFWAGLNHVSQMVQASKPRIILYATWARKASSPDLEKLGWTPETMTQLLHSAYEKAADALNAAVSPVGINFQKVAVLAPQIDLHDPDLSHPSYRGSCLAALTHYHTLFGTFPENTEVLSLTDAERSVFKAVVCQ